MDKYMNYISSNYPNAQYLGSYSGTDEASIIKAITPGNRVSSDKNFYLTAHDVNALNNVFRTIFEDSSSSSTSLNENAVLKDVISDKFDVTDATTATVAAYSGSTDGSSYTFSTTPTTDQYRAVIEKDTKTVTVTGFDYSTKFIAPSRNGQKLVVTVTGLIPNDGFGDSKMLSNAPGAGIYESASATTPTAEFPSPWTKVPVYTKVLDFSMAANIATNVLQTNSNLNGTYGTFDLSSNNLTYKLGNRVADGNLVFDGVDSVLFYGDYNDDGNDTAARWNKVNVIPANNVYFDDDLLDYSSDFKDSDQGYDSASVNYGVDKLDANTTKTLTFTGTGIDVYCTTEADSGSVYAKLRAVDAEGNVINSLVTDAAGNKVMDGSMNNTYVSNPSLINVPTLSFTGLTYGTYQLTIRTGNNENYKLDGVRIYNPANADAVAVGKESGIDVKAQFVNVREQLLSATPTGLTEGAVYVDEKHDTNDISVYEKDGPKNEVYLAQNQKVGFKLTGVPEGATVLVGLSAPENRGSAAAKVTCGEATTTLAVNSAIDMYYPVEVSRDGNVVIENTSNVLLSVTNVQISSGDGTSSAMVMSSPELMSYMADFDALTVVDTTPAPEAPTPETPNNTISAIIHAIWAQVRDSIGKLFGRL